jgi:uncharacterized metal-binding protein YceD (DUF177 family)
VSDVAEFSRPLDVRQVEGLVMNLTASKAECAALAARFGLVRIGRLEAEVAMTRDGRNVNAAGNLSADIVQTCAVSGDELPVLIREPLALRFVPAGSHQPDEEVELDADSLDEIEYDGSHFDIGEAVAQSLALAIDPFAVGPGAENARAEAGLLNEGETGPFAALKGLIGNGSQ